jgi:hypothetical protein
MKKSIIFMALFICFTIPSFSQTGFRPGFIITNELDTIKGQLAYLDESILLRSCQFIAEGVSTAATYTPGEIFGYGFTGDKFFVSKEVTVFTPSYIRRSPIGDTQVPESSVQENVFLELVVQGAANLYKYNGAVFYVGKNNEFYQLYSEEREVAVQTGATTTFYTEEIKRYVGVLQMIMKDCVGFGERVNSVSLTEESLAKLFIDYSKCIGVSPVFFKEGRKKTTFNISLLGGIMGSKNNFVYPIKRNRAFSEANLGFQTRPGLGALLSLSSPRYGEKVSLQLGLFLVHYEYEGFASITEGVLTHNHTIEMALTEVKIPIGIKYAFIRRTLTPYVSGGGIFVVNSGVRDEWLWEEVGSIGSTVRKTPESFIKGSQIGGWFSGGMEIPVMSKISFLAEVGFHYTNGLMSGKSSNFQISRSEKITTQILVGLKF